MLADVLYRYQGWVKLLVASLLWKIAWYLLAPWKQVFRESVFRSFPAQCSLDSVSVNGVFINRHLPSKGCLLAESLVLLRPITHKGDSHIWYGFFRFFWLLEIAPSAHMTPKYYPETYPGLWVSMSQHLLHLWSLGVPEGTGSKKP